MSAAGVLWQDPPLHSLTPFFQEDSLVAEIADQVERYPEGDDIL